MRSILPNLLGFSLTLVLPVSADILFSNLGQTENFALTATGPGPVWACDFQTDAASTILTGMTFNVPYSQLIPQTFRVAVAVDDGSGRPGEVIGAFDTTLTVPALGFGN